MSVLRRVDWRDSWTGTRLSGSWTRLRRTLEASTVATWVWSVAAVAVLAARNSRVGDAARWSWQMTRRSWLYRQFTMDTEPAVVTLDLRETRTLGPILAAVERFAETGTETGTAAEAETGTGAETETGADRRVHDGAAVSGLWEAVRASPVRTVSAAVVGAVAANLLVVVLFESPSRAAIGARLLVGVVAFLGTSVRASADQVADSYTARVVERLLTPPEPPEQSADDGDSDGGPPEP